MLEAGSRGEVHTVGRVPPLPLPLGYLQAALLTGLSSVPKPCRAQGTWVSPCHWAASASPRMPEMKSPSCRQERGHWDPIRAKSPEGGVLGPCGVEAREVAFPLQRAGTRSEKPQSGTRPHPRRPFQDTPSTAFIRLWLSEI